MSGGNIANAVLAAVRSAPFWFVRPDSNLAPLVELQDRDDNHVADGEDVMEAHRLGFLWCKQESGGPVLATGGVEDLPDIEATHRYYRTPAGERAIGMVAQAEVARDGS